MKEISLRVTGKVQGVFYRDSIKKAADKLDLKGYARNEEDGSVRVVAQGKEEILESFMAHVWQGSPRAEVQNVDVTWQNPSGNYNGFRIF